MRPIVHLSMYCLTIKSNIKLKININMRHNPERFDHVMPAGYLHVEKESVYRYYT